MSSPVSIHLPCTTKQRAALQDAPARAEGYAWAILGVQHHGTPDAESAAAFAADYAACVAESLSGTPTDPPSVPRAWVAWRNGGDLTADLTVHGSRTANPVPGLDASTAALRDPTARAMFFEALGYVRGWCDAAGVGSGDAVDFAHTYAVLVAARASRPNIADAWTNWRSDRPIAQLTHLRYTAPTDKQPH
ncbi:hypothetical protein OG225_41860 (plasmid) [Nocardia sp. NBC_01377]|uniref:hypothetical protein n=1 Tax=Nocardia sp. NBC_01377 TaxID=2903595 RepID=UPI002F9167C7